MLRRAILKAAVQSAREVLSRIARQVVEQVTSRTIVRVLCRSAWEIAVYVRPYPCPHAAEP